MPTFTRKLSELIQEDFDFGLTDIDYPLYDESYRQKLNDKILKHYWNYEIGQETESMFRFALNRKMNEIMPLYNQLYLSAQLEIDPLLTMKYSDIVNATDHITGNTTANGTINGTNGETVSGNTSSESDSKARNVTSDTPQMLLSPNEDYASGASNSVSNVTATGTTSSTTAGTNDVASTDASNRVDDRTSNNTRNLLGFNIPPTDLLLKFRATFLNIDMLVIDELQTLFMQVWDNGDEFSASEGLMYGVTPFGW